MSKIEERKEQPSVVIESRTRIKKTVDYTGTFNPVYRKMMDEGLV